MASICTEPLRTRSAWTTEDQRWQAVLERDKRADGVFVYSVRTTGIYCRPVCPAKRPKRGHVAFHDSPEAAEREGFRACRRCRPDEGGGAERHAQIVAAACRTIESEDRAPGLSRLAKAAGMSPFHFHRIFLSVTGVTPKSYALAHRANRVRSELCRRDSVTEAVYAAGYQSGSRFYEHTFPMLGMTPERFRKKGPGETISFAAGECSLGAFVVAATKAGLCAVLLGDDPMVLVRDLQDRFSAAELQGGDPQFEKLVAAVIGHIDSDQPLPSLPLDIRGTLFQQRVWNALREIPRGETASYAQIAESIGLPGAARAVGRACGANPLAVVIPCHRVVRCDGSLSGYRWGIDRKKRLLAREGAGGGGSGK